MSIKNPYENYFSNAYLRTAYDSFNFGVKAANEDWIEWAENLLRLLTKHEEAFPCSCYRRASRIVAARKKEINQ